MSSAKAALESDTRVLAWEAGRKHSIRVNAISAGPLGSRAAKAIGFIDDMIKCGCLTPCSTSALLQHAFGCQLRREQPSLSCSPAMAWIDPRALWPGIHHP